MNKIKNIRSQVIILITFLVLIVFLWLFNNNMIKNTYNVRINTRNMYSDISKLPNDANSLKTLKNEFFELLILVEAEDIESDIC